MGDVSACTAIYPKVRQPSGKMLDVCMLDYQSSPDNKTTLNEVGKNNLHYYGQKGQLHWLQEEVSLDLSPQ